MLRLLRRNWLQVLALSATAAFVCALAVAGCGGSAAGRAVGAVSTPTARPSATPDPRIAQVEAAVRAWNAALVAAYRSGSVAELHALAVPDSPADGDAGAPLVEIHAHRTDLVSSLMYESISVDIEADHALASVSFDTTGYQASWPDLKPITSATTVRHQVTYDFQSVGNKWLLDAQR